MSSDVDTRRLTDLESVIDRGLATFVDVGQALAEIRDARLYRDSHATFEEYLHERWGMSAGRGRQLMRAAETVAAIPSGTAVPATEAQARELAPLREEPKRLAEAATIATEKAAAEERPATARDYRTAVREVREPTLAEQGLTQRDIDETRLEADRETALRHVTKVFLAAAPMRAEWQWVIAGARRESNPLERRHIARECDDLIAHLAELRDAVSETGLRAVE